MPSREKDQKREEYLEISGLRTILYALDTAAGRAFIFPPTDRIIKHLARIHDIQDKIQEEISILENKNKEG